MNRINQELLRSFVAIAAERTFARAAAARHVSKSAISQQMKVLEAQLGQPLFERVGRHAVITAPARRLAETLRNEFQIIDDAVATLSASHAELSGEVALGAPRLFASMWVRPRIAALMGATPALRLRLRFGTPTELEAQLIARELDLAVLVRPPTSNAVHARPIYNEVLCAYGPRPARGARPLTLQQLRAARWIAFDPDLAMHAPWWRAHGGRRAGRQGEIVAYVASLDEMLALVEAGVGHAVLPAYVAAPALAAGRVVQHLRRADAPEVSNRIYLAWRDGAIATARLDAVRAALLV